MKLDLFLFIFALCLAFLSGNMTYSLKVKSKGTFKDLEEVRKLHLELQEVVTPYKRLDLNSDYNSPEKLKLLYTPNTLARQDDPSFILNSSECLKSKISQLASDFINKETLWIGYLCNQINKLPKSFFNSPPYLYSNGHSYAFLQFQMLNTHNQRVNWLENYAEYMTLTELKKLNWSTSSNQRFLLTQSNEIIQNIIEGENTFLSNRFYFIKTGNLKYYVIDRPIAEKFFSRAMYSMSTDDNRCIFKLSNVCWHKKPINIHNLSESTILFFMGTMIILFITAQSLFSRWRRKKEEEDRKKHALRIMTHELRTPIASLMVQVNSLNKNLSHLSSDTQEAFVKIESQVYRLKHLAEKSQSYLQTQSSELINLNKCQIPSLEDFISDILFEYEDDDFKLNIIKDGGLFVDPYWLKMCIMNLIDNALRYGKKPIEIRVDFSENLSIQIIDQGIIPYLNLKELLKTKHKNSKGLGLGLIIVNRTIKEMGAKLSLSTDPTTFTITFPKDMISESKEIPHEENTAH